MRTKIFQYAVNLARSFRFAFCKKGFGIYGGPEREEKIIISLTSFPARLNKLHLCLQSLLLQSVRPDKIVLWLAEDEMSGVRIPSKVSSLTKYGLEIRMCDNLRSHNKYFYAMQEFPDAAIITVDDDFYYPKTLTETLLNGHERWPEDVICTRAHKIKIADGKIAPYSQWEGSTADVEHPSHSLMATGVEGVLYPARCLPGAAFDKENIRKLCLKADDVWLMAMEILGDVKVCAVESPKSRYSLIVGTQKKALWKSNVGQNQNDVYIKAVFDFYGIKSSRFIE